MVTFDSKMYINILFFVILSFAVPQLILSASVGSSQCPPYVNDEIQQCVQPVALYAKVLNQRDNTSTENPESQNQFGNALQLPKIGGEVFKELCRLIKDFETCVEPHRKRCPKHITINLIEASYGYLCNAGYETFMNSAECLMELDQKPSVKHCHDETLRDIEKANEEHGITMPAKLDRMCEALNFFSGCVRHPIRHNCGLEAWKVIFRVLKDTTKTLMPACQFTGTSSKIAHNRHHSKQTKTENLHVARPSAVDPREKPDHDPEEETMHVAVPVSYQHPSSISDTIPKEEEIIVVNEERAQFSQLEANPDPVPSKAFGQYISFLTLIFSFIYYFLTF